MIEKHKPITEELFQAQFLQFHGQLKSYLLRLTTNRQDAEDLAQDAYIKAVTRLATFTGESTLKTWVFAIATNLARDHFRVQNRWQEDAQDRCRQFTRTSPERVAQMHQIVNNSPVERYQFKEHIDYCFTCLAKTLEIEQQLALILKEVYGFKVKEIMAILQLSNGQVKYALSQARRTMADIFDQRCALVNQNGVCYQCSEINGFVNPKQDAREEWIQLKMVQEAENGASKEHLFAMRMKLVESIDPLNVPGTELHLYLLKLIAENGEQEPTATHNVNHDA